MIEYVFGLPIVRRAYVAATGECVYHVRGVVSPECGGVFVVCGGCFFFGGGITALRSLHPSVSELHSGRPCGGRRARAWV